MTNIVRRCNTTSYFRHYGVNTALTLATACLFLQFVPAAPVPQSEYVFVAYTNRWLEINRADVCLFGKVDAEGNFRVERTTGPDPISGPASVTINKSEPYTAYEFRSGRLIHGTMMPSGTFVPEAGSKVTRFEDFKYSPDSIPIWNLPGYFMSRDKLEERRKWLAENAGKNSDFIAEKARLDAAIKRKK